MMRGIRGVIGATLLCVLWLALIVFTAPTALMQEEDPVRRVRQPVRGTYLVVLQRDDDPEFVGREAARRYRGRIRHVYRAVRGFAIRLPDAAAQVLARDPRVAFVEEDGMVGAATVQRSLPSWGLDRIDQRDLPLDGRFRYFAGPRRSVYVMLVDSGIRATHQEFGGRAFIAGDFVDDDADGDPEDLANDDPDPSRPDGTDCFGHGTAVAGVAAGERAGVAKKALIWSYRVIGCDGTGAWSAVIAAIDEITTAAPRPAVVNLSLAGGVSTAANAAIRRSIASGATYVVAAGNHDDDAANYSPSSVREAVVVGSTTMSDRRQHVSNFGPLLDLFAPGEEIASASPHDDSALNINSGTSLAAPHVAGIAARYLEVHPDASPTEIRNALVRAATRGRLIDAGPGSPNRLAYSRARPVSAGRLSPR